MKKISAKFLVATGLTIFVLGLLMLAFQLRVMPNPLEAKLKTRAFTCETIAVNASLIANTKDLESINKFLEISAARDPELISVGMRRDDGTLVASANRHEEFWKEQSHYPTETHVKVPILAAEGKEWGKIEFTFQSISQPGLLGFFANPTVRFLSFVIPSAFFIFYFYLGRMLKVMNATSVPQRVRTALNTLAGGLIVMDEHGDIVLANESIAKWVGTSSDDLMGKRIGTLPWHELDLKTSAWSQALKTQQPVTGQTARLRSKSGNRTLIVNASPMVGHNGELRGAFVGFEDVTLLEEKEIEHKRLRQEAEQANSAKSDFLARMSHEIRTPMNAILGFTDVLRRGFDSSPEERDEYLNTIHSSGEHLLSLINDILDLSKVEAGRMELERKWTSPHKTILETLRVLQVRAEEKGLTLSYEPTDRLPEVIETDPVRLRQIVTNLVGNAIKFTDSGGVRVLASMVGGQFEFSVVDTGIGINEESLKKIFDPFSQADSSITRKFGGTGLGLAIAKHFAEMMGGGIRVTSSPGRGTAFTVMINTGDLSQVRHLDREESLKAMSQRSEKVMDLKLPKCRVLIVDDGASNRRLLRLFLQRAGADLVEAENGQEAIDRVNEKPFDVILMDMQMPVMDGYTAATTLRQQGCTTPIVALTAHAMAEDETKCLNAGCSHFLSKPIDTNRLLKLMGQVIDGGVLEPLEGPQSVPQVATVQPESDVASVASVATPQPVAAPPVVAAPEPVSVAQPAAAPPAAPVTPAITPDSVPAPGENTVAAAAAPPAVPQPVAVVPAALVNPTAETAEPPVVQSVQVAESDTAQLETDTAVLGSETTSPKTTPLTSSLSMAAVAEVCAPAPAAKTDVMPSADTAVGDLSPILSDLPTEDPEFRELVVEFVEHMFEKLQAMDDAVQQQDLTALADLAHWLKGSGGTAGFHEFTQPAAALEKLAKSMDINALPAAMAELRQIADRIYIPA